MPADPGRLAGRPGARRTAGRGRGAVVRDLDTAAPDLPDDSPPWLSPDSGIAIAAGLAAVVREAVLALADVARGREVGRRAGRAGRAGAAPAAGFAACIDFAAVISAFAAEVIALVAVFIDCIAEDIVRADAVAFVAAAVILVAADVTFVAADETPLAAVAGVAAPRLGVVRRVVVVRVVPARPAGPRPVVVPVLRRAAVARDAVEREAVDRAVVLRVDRAAVLRGVDRDAVLRAGVAALLRPADDVADDVLEPDADFDRLAVPCDALRLTGLPRAELAELRRVAARVVD